jgi:hypothetical protein
MRSQLVFNTASDSNRYQLVKLAAKATRRFHRPNTRIQDTVNEVFSRLAAVRRTNYVPHLDNVQPFPAAVRPRAAAPYKNRKQFVA